MVERLRKKAKVKKNGAASAYFHIGKQYLGRREAARNAFFVVVNIFW